MQRNLADDVLVLAIDDRARYRTRGPVGIALAAAEHVERALAEPITPAAEARRRRALAAALRTDAATSVDRVAHRLAAAGVVGPLEHRVLGVFPRRGHVVHDLSAHRDARDRLAGVLAPGGRPDPHGAALAVLCAVSGIARSYVPPPSDKASRQAVAQHLNDLRSVVGPAAAEVLDAARAAYRRSGDAGGGFVPASGNDCYGDAGGDGGGGDGGGDGGGGGD